MQITRKNRSRQLNMQGRKVRNKVDVRQENISIEKEISPNVLKD